MNSYKVRKLNRLIAESDRFTPDEKRFYALYTEYRQYCGLAQREHRSYLKSFEKWLRIFKGITDDPLTYKRPRLMV